ncbi:MAG: hypothetical protein MJB14_06285 [Spirochaetes bacterium]|nr:hypothetical protein [Spirochaetota bacterium]
MADQDITKVNIEVPKKLFNLIADMAKNANQEFKTNLSAKDLIEKWVIQYFGTKNALDIMAFSTQKFPEPLKDKTSQIMDLFQTFQQTAIKFDEISTQSNQLFKEVINILENIPETKEQKEEEIN